MDVCLELPSALSLFCPELTDLSITGRLKQQDKFQMEPFTITVASSVYSVALQWTLRDVISQNQYARGYRCRLSVVQRSMPEHMKREV